MKPVWLIAAAGPRRLPLVAPAPARAARARRGRDRGRSPMAVYSTGLVELPDIDKLLEDIGRALGPWTYLLVGVLAYAEAAAFLGLRRAGRDGDHRRRRRRRPGRDRHHRAHRARLGVLGRGRPDRPVRSAGGSAAVPPAPRPARRRVRGARAPGRRLLRAPRRQGRVPRALRRAWPARSSPFLAGSSGMPLRRFLPYDVLGAGIQTTALCLLGYVFWHSLDRVLAIAKQGALALGATIAGRRRARRGGALAARAGEPPAHRRLAGGPPRQPRGPARCSPPAAASAAPVRASSSTASRRATSGSSSRRSWRSAAVGGYVFFGYLMVLDGDALTPGDRARGGLVRRRARRLPRRPRERSPSTSARCPSSPSAVVIVAVGLLALRERLEALVLVGGLGAHHRRAAAFDDGVVRGTAPAAVPPSTPRRRPPTRSPGSRSLSRCAGSGRSRRRRGSWRSGSPWPPPRRSRTCTCARTGSPTSPAASASARSAGASPASTGLVTRAR